MTCARPRCNATSSKHFPHTSQHPTLHTCTSPQLISSELFSSHFMSSHMSAKFFLVILFHVIWAQLNLSHLTEASLNSSRLVCTSEKSLRHRCIYTERSLQNTLYYKACTKHVPVLLCTTKLAQNTSQYYFVLKSLHKALPSTTLYYKACTKYFPVLLCTKKLAQTTSQYYFVLQSLHKVRPSTTLYYKACTKHVPVLLCTTKLAQNTFQYYFVLQSLHKVVPSTTLYYKACTKHFPVLLCTTKRLHTEHLHLHTVLLHMASVYTHRNFYAETLLHTEKLLHTASFYTQNLLHTASFYRKKLHREAFLYIITTGIAAPKPDLDAKAKKRRFWNTFKRNFERNIASAKTEKICWQTTVATFIQPLQYYLRDPAAKDKSITHAAAAPRNLDAATSMRPAEELRAMASEIAAPKPDGSRHQSEKKNDFETLFKRNCKRKIASAKIEKICWQITVAALMQPLQYDLRSPAAKR